MQTESTNLIEFLAHVAWCPWDLGAPSLQLPDNLYAVGNNTVRLIIAQKKLMEALNYGITFIIY